MTQSHDAADLSLVALVVVVVAAVVYDSVCCYHVHVPFSDGVTDTHAVLHGPVDVLSCCQVSKRSAGGAAGTMPLLPQIRNSPSPTLKKSPMPRMGSGSLSELLSLARQSTSKLCTPRSSSPTTTTCNLTCDSLNSSAHGDANESVVSFTSSVVGAETSSCWSADSFRFNRLLGSGSFITVWLADYECGPELEPQQFAVKKIPKKYAEQKIETMLHEKQIMKELSSPFIVQLLGTCQSSDELLYIFDVVECGDLWTAIYNADAKKERMPHELTLFYAFGILLGLDHLFSHSIVYRDLKPENVTIDKAGYPRIVDFGLARKLAPGETRKTLCGTPEYLAPEIVLNSSSGAAGYSYPVDLWAFGVILYEMIMKRTPFCGKTPGDLTQLFTNICHVQKCGVVLSAAKVDARSGHTPHARDLMTRLFSGDPDLRLCGGSSPGGLLEHPYFATAPFTAEELTAHRVKAPRLQPVHVGCVVEANTGKAKIETFSGNQAVFADF